MHTICLALIAGLLAVTAAWAGPKKLIEYGWDVPAPTFVAQHIRQMEQRPFDGLIFRVPKIGQVFEKTAVSEDDPEVARELAALPTIKWGKFTDNFVVMYAASTMDWFSDDDWQAVLHNVRLCAKAARLARCVGVCFDAEPYGNNPWEYSTQAQAGSKSFDEYRAVVRRRGAAFMRAIQEELPHPVLHTFFILSLFAPDENLERHPYGLFPAFLDGWLDAAEPGTVITDGNEGSYYYTQAGQFTRMRDAIHGGRLGLVAPANRAKYRRHVQCAQALYVDHLFATRTKKYASAFMSSVERARWWEHNVYWALTTSDRYVWLYSERMSWWGPCQWPMPAGLEAATIAGRRAAAAGTPPTYDLAPAFKRADRRQAEELAAKMARRRADIPRLAARPVIDGDLADAAWQAAAALEPFVRDFGSEGGPLAAATTARVGYDSANLYVAVTAQEPAMAELRVVGRNRDDSIWSGDAVDLFISTTGQSPEPYHHFITNPAGVRWDAAAAKGQEDLAWNPSYETATRREGSRWTWELAVPWQSLGMKAPQAGDTLFANVCRQRMAQAWELSSWSQVANGFVEPANFGVWRFQ